MSTNNLKARLGLEEELRLLKQDMHSQCVESEEKIANLKIEILELKADFAS